MLRIARTTAVLLVAMAIATPALAEEVTVVGAGPQSFGGAVLVQVAAVTGYNVNIVEYDGGQFRFIGEGKWIELNKTDQNHYIEVNRLDTEVQLFDPGRNVSIVLSTIVGGFITYAVGKDQPIQLYPVTAVHN